MADEGVSLALSEEQRTELAAAIRSASSARLYRQIKVVQWMAAGYAVGAVRRLAEVSRSGVRRYLDAYGRGGGAAPKVVADLARIGRARPSYVPNDAVLQLR